MARQRQRGRAQRRASSAVVTASLLASVSSLTTSNDISFTTSTCCASSPRAWQSAVKIVSFSLTSFFAASRNSAT
eukprot:scaffold114948_cov69-Phaeocystis_antarctica.AAC.3